MTASLLCTPHLIPPHPTPPRAGAKKREEIYQAFEQIYPVLKEFKKGGMIELPPQQGQQQQQAPPALLAPAGVMPAPALPMMAPPAGALGAPAPQL